MSGKTSTASKDKYNKKVYKQYALRIRKGSDLYAEIEAFKSQQGTSFNYLTTKLLCEHFNVSIPDPADEYFSIGP